MTTVFITAAVFAIFILVEQLHKVHVDTTKLIDRSTPEERAHEAYRRAHL